jgi:hypothetical protein
MPSTFSVSVAENHVAQIAPQRPCHNNALPNNLQAHVVSKFAAGLQLTDERDGALARSKRMSADD